MKIAIDFDGTCVEHEYPKIGKTVPNVLKVLQKLVKSGHSLILYTMRSGKELEAAKQWFEENDIPLWAVNENPTQMMWTTSPKVYADLYIDDAALGVPLTSNENPRSYVNWKAVEGWLLQKGVIPNVEE